MKNLLLAFLFIGFVTVSSYAAPTVLSTGAEIEFCEDGKKCTKKDCKHAKKSCKASKKECSKKASAKACCSKKASEGKKCCASASAKTCSKSKEKAGNTKEENKEKRR